MKIRVYYEDTDVGGVVYYANYLKFCERARSELFFKKGLTPHISDMEFFVVKEVDAKYIKPAKFGDLLDVSAKLESKKSASLIMYQEVRRENELLFTARFKLAYLKEFKPAKIPQELFEVFLND